MTQRIVAWLGRFVLFGAIAIFTLIGVRYLTNPVGAAAEFQTSFASPAGATSMRVGFGAFPLAFAAILAVCLFSARRRRLGLAMVTIIMGLASAARLVGIAVDGPAAESSRLLVPELVMTGLSLFCGLFERSRGAATAPPARALESNHDHPGRRPTGTLLVALVAVVLIGSALSKLLGLAPVVAQLDGLGFGRLIPLVASLELASGLLVAFSLTRAYGLFLASAFLGGAIAAHLGHEWSSRFLGASVVLGLLWLGAWLRSSAPASLARGAAEERASA
jgi:hypothetical protein